MLSLQLLSLVFLPTLQFTAAPPQRAERLLHLDSLKATIRIVDNTATTELEQVFINRGSVPAEETYLWPLPEGASVSDFQLWVDGKAQKAELLDKDKARGVYEDIVRTKRDPGLLEWAGLGCVRASVFPVPPRGEGRVKIKYTHTLSASANLFEYVLPVRLAALAPEGIRSFIIDGVLESQRALSSIYSPTHSLDLKQTGERGARFSYEGSGATRDKDFILTFIIPEREFGALLLTHRSPGADGFFTLAVTPRFDLGAASVQPKDVIFVCDTSGSMQGEKIEQAKKALSQCIGRLNTNDRFAIIRFSTEAESFSPNLLDSTKDNIDAARGWIQKIEARGGTNIDEALSTALKLKKSDGRLSMIFFMTDGCPTVGVTDIQQLIDRVKSNNVQNLRLFTFGVGFDVNTQLLDAIAKETRAEREYVRPQEDVEMKVSALFDKVGSPVLSNVSISCDGAEFYDIYPKQVPDLFKGSQLLLTGRYRGTGARTLKIAGTLGDASREWNYNINLPAVEERYDSIAPLWATRKVGFLMNEIRLRGQSKELLEEIKRLAREYNIITPYTSFLVVEDARRLSSARGIAPRDGRARADGVATADDDLLALGYTNNRDSLTRLEDFAKPSSGEGAVDKSKDAGDLAGATSNNPSLRPGRRQLGDTVPPAGGNPATTGPRPSGPTTPGGGGPSGPTTGPPGGAPAIRYVGGTVNDEKKLDTITEATKRFSKAVGSRVFQLINKVWIDTSFTEKDRERIVKIKFLSDDYFALLKKEPDLAACLSLGERVVVQCKGTFYEIEP